MTDAVCDRFLIISRWRISMNTKISTRITTLAAIVTLALTIESTVCPNGAAAHENHAPLPTKGVTIAGDNVLLSDKAREAIGLTIEKVTFSDLHRTVEVNARVELPWNQQAMITSLVPGKIEQVLVRPGETVAAGQELARVASMELESLQLAMLMAAGEIDFAQRLVTQRKKLSAEGVIPGQSLLEAETSLTQKTAELRIAEEKLRAIGIDNETLGTIRQSGKTLRFVPVTSPIAGIVTHADVRIGQVVKTTDHLYHIANPSRVWIVGEVLESDVRHLKKGQPVTASFAAYPDRRFEGVIDHVRLKMDRRRRTQSVVIAVDNTDGMLRPGMFGRAEIAVQVTKEAIVCPADAIIKSRTGRYVLVQRMPGKYENRQVRLGLAKGKKVEILEGLFPGDYVVVTGVYLLSSLLGNEHKARTTGDSPAAESEDSAEEQEPITVADATVELPTDQQSFASPRIKGRIRSVLVQPSHEVRPGQVLAEVDSLELRTVQLDLLQTVSRLRLSEQSLAIFQQLGNQGAAPQRRIWELRNQKETLLLQLASLKRRLAFFGLTDEEIAALQQADLVNKNAEAKLLTGVPIRAPAGGWIVGFNVVPGQVVHPEDQIFEIHDLSRVWVKGYVFERNAGQVAVGQAATVTFPAFPDLEAVGTVVRIAPMMEENERVLPIWIEVDNADRLLKEGMLARVTVHAKNTNIADSPAENAQLRPIESLR